MPAQECTSNIVYITECTMCISHMDQTSKSTCACTGYRLYSCVHYNTVHVYPCRCKNTDNGNYKRKYARVQEQYLIIVNGLFLDAE